METKEIKTVSQVIAWFKTLAPVLGGGFHPDTPFEEYVNTETGEPTYTPEEAEENDRLLDEAFEVCQRTKRDIYELGGIHVHGWKTFYQRWVDGEKPGLGAFHKRLMEAYACSDAENGQKLETAFPELFTYLTHKLI